MGQNAVIEAGRCRRAGFEPDELFSSTEFLIRPRKGPDLPDRITREMVTRGSLRLSAIRYEITFVSPCESTQTTAFFYYLCKGLYLIFLFFGIWELSLHFLYCSLVKKLSGTARLLTRIPISFIRWSLFCDLSRLTRIAFRRTTGGVLELDSATA